MPAAAVPAPARRGEGRRTSRLPACYRDSGSSVVLLSKAWRLVPRRYRRAQPPPDFTWTAAAGCGTRALAMQPTRPPDDRRARHEATGEWPQPPLSTMLAHRVRRTPDRVYMIEGRREGGRTHTFADLAARADRMAV